jgi:hypothetical protein
LLAAAVLAAAAFATAPVQAREYPWCAQYSGQAGGARNCGFVSFQQCLATVSGIGGFCERNSFYTGPEPRRYRRHTEGYER